MLGCKVYANGQEIACKAGGGKVIASFPDVCLSPPSPPAGPVPVPYPDTSFSKDMKNGSKTVKIGGKEVMLKDQSFYKSSPLGDEAATRGLGAGAVTHVITGKTYFVAWSMDVKFEGQNVDRNTDLTTSNHASAPGNASVPNLNLSATAIPGPCPPHHWDIIEQKTPSQAKADNATEAARLKGKGGKTDLNQARSLEFANTSIDHNMTIMNIQACEVKIKCQKCGEEGEIDILGSEQVGESYSEPAKTTDTSTRKSKQATRLNGIQDRINHQTGKSHKPKAKIDKDIVGDEFKARKTCKRRNFQPEFV